MKNLAKITIIILCLALSNIDAHSQKLGYGFFTPNTQFALAGQTVDAVATLQAGFDMGVGLYLNDNLGLYAGIGAYRSIRSFNSSNSFCFGRICSLYIFSATSFC